MLDALRTFYETSYANVHRGVYELSERATAAYEGARQTLATFVNAPSPKEIVFTRNATEGLNLVAYAWGLVNLGPGDLVVVTELEHHSNFVPVAVHRQADRRELHDDPARRAGRARPRALWTRLRARGQRARSSPRTSSPTRWARSTRSRGSSAWAHEQGAIMVVDAAQAAPHRPIDVQALGCDFLAFSSHKLCGPTSIGALWGRLELLEAMEPFNLGGHMIRAVRAEETTWGEVPAKFEAGTQPIAEAVGFARRGRLHHRGRARVDRAARARARRRTRSSGWPRFRASSSTGRRPSGARASSRSTSATCTRTTSRRCWTWKAWRSARGTTAASR